MGCGSCLVRLEPRLLDVRNRQKWGPETNQYTFILTINQYESILGNAKKLLKELFAREANNVASSRLAV